MSHTATKTTSETTTDTTHSVHSLAAGDKVRIHGLKGRAELNGAIATVLEAPEAGKYKVEGNPFEPLSDEARAAIQASVDAFYDMFIAAVARNRAVDEDVVRNGFGQGRTVLADQAVREGMADRVGTLDDTLARFGVSRRSAPRNSAAKPRLNLARRKLDLLTQ